MAETECNSTIHFCRFDLSDTSSFSHFVQTCFLVSTIYLRQKELILHVTIVRELFWNYFMTQLQIAKKIKKIIIEN